MKNINNMNAFKPVKVKGQPKWVLALLLTLFGFGANAQSAETTNIMLTLTLVLVVIVALLVLIVAIYTLQVIKVVVKDKQRELSGETEEEATAAATDEPSWWQKFLKVANDRVDMEEEEDILLDHNYDGIQELDNHLPPWWKYLFYATIAFGVVYVILYHVTDTLPLQQEEYAIEVVEAAAAAEARLAANAEAGGFDESALEYSDDPIILANGETIYQRMCAACHKADGGGSIGPNLTDNYWLHGNTIQDIYRTIKVGVPDKGMISWESQLSPVQMRDVSSYIISLKGTNPPGAKAPQGELYE